MLLYASEICGYSYSRSNNLYNQLKNDVFEKCHLRFLRFILGVNRKAPNIAIYGDTGRYPMSIDAIVLHIKYWYRILQTNTGDLLQEAYIESTKMNNSWLLGVKKILKFSNLSMEKARKMKLSTLCKMVKSRCRIIYIDGWKEELLNDKRHKGGNKLRLYRKFKDKFMLEPYLISCVNTKQKKNMARLRLSCHKLQIEVLRYSKDYIEPKLRICKMCSNNECEDEIHFLLKCPKYAAERSKLLNMAESICPNFIYLDDLGKFIYLMSCPESKLSNELARFISNCFDLRSSTKI